MTENRALYTHFILCSFGIIGLSKYLSKLIGSLILPTVEPVVVNDHLADFFYYPEKRYQLFHYALMVILLTSYYLTAYFLSNKKEISRYFQPIIKDIKNVVFASVVVLATNIVLLNPHNTGNPRRFILGSIVWLCVLLLPLLMSFTEDPRQKITRLYYLICFYAGLQLVLVFAPFVFREPKMINEFFNIPEETLLETESKKSPSSYSVYASNTIFIKEHNLFGNQRDIAPQRISRKDDRRTEDRDLIQQFLKKNTFEIHWQILNRWVIHHHNFILGPINEYSFGKRINDIYIQYGWLNIMLTKKILDWTGGINYQNYFKVWYSYYYLYYAIFLLAIVFLLKDIKYITVAILSVSYILHHTGFNYLFLGPGLNPIRHFFDIISVILLFLYFEKKNTLFYYLLLLASLAGVLNNSQVGLFSLASVFAVLTFHLFKEKKISIGIIVPGIAALCTGVILSGFAGGRNDFAKYYLAGLLGFPFPDVYLILIGLVLSAGFALLPKMVRATDNLKYVALYLFFYSQALLVYYVWGATENHLLNFAPIYALTCVVFLKLLIAHTNFLKVRVELILGGLIIALLIPFNSAVRKYHNEKSDYENIFKVHKTYQWDFERAKFTSTMDPRYFAEAVSLIQNYSDQNGIYILSKYDIILPFLADKFSAMPFYDVSNFLITAKEIELCKRAVKEKRPRYLFVDADIDQDLSSDIIEEGVPIIGYLHDESVWRVQRLNLLKNIFDAVRNDYRIVKRGFLISVYKLHEKNAI